MERFFNAKSVAVIGASSKPGKIGYSVLSSILTSGYKGRIFPINPNEESILNTRVYKTIFDVPGNIDLAIIVLGSNAVPGIIEDCGKKGIRRVVIISGGFKEMGGSGVELERKVVEAARKHDIRIIGPNCIGVFDGSSRLNTFFQPDEYMIKPNSGNVAFLTQSGTYGASILEWFAQLNVGVSRFVSYGNKCDVDEIDMLNYLEKDDSTKVVGLYIEGIKNGREFIETVKRVARKKPVVILKAGRTSKGATAAKSHTGALAGNDAVFSGAMKQCNAIMVDDIDEMVDILNILSNQPLPKGGNIAMATNGAGPCVIAIDAIQNTPLDLAKLGEETIKKLKEKLPQFCIFSNPVDLTGSADANFYDASLRALAEDPNVDIVVPVYVIQDSPLASTIEGAHKTLQELKNCNKTVVCLAGGGPFTELQAKRMQGYGMPLITTAHRIVTALSKIVIYAKNRERK